MVSKLAVRMVLSIVCIYIYVAPFDATAQTASPDPSFKDVTVSADAFSLGDALPAWIDTVEIPSTSTDSPIVVKLADTQVLIENEPIVFVHRALLVNDAASLTSAGQLSIQFIPQYQRLQLHTVRILRGRESLDRTRSSTLRFLQREIGLEQGIYSGTITASILVNDLRVGDTIEVAYSLHGQNPAFGGKFVNVIPWDQGYQTEFRRVALMYPTTREISWRLLGDRQADKLDLKETTNAELHKLVFEEHSVPGVTPEPLTPSDYITYRTLQFSEFKTWNEVARWGDALFHFDGSFPEELRSVLDRLREIPSTEERIAGALEFVQSEIRYFSLSLGESSHVPTQPARVLERRFGDCKDKSFLLITMLRALGVESEPVLVRLGQRQGLDKLLPSPQIFDHAIVQASVGDKTYYLDPTRLGQHGRLDRMGQTLEGAEVLPVSPSTQELVVIPAEPPELSHSEVIETASLSAFDSDAKLQVHQVWNGVAAEALRVMVDHLPRERLTKSIGDAMGGRYPGSKLLEEPTIRDDRVNNVLSITSSYTVPKFATEKDGNWFVRFVPSNIRGALAPSPSSSRKIPLSMPRFPVDAEYTFEMTFPESVSAAGDPWAHVVQSRYFSYGAKSAFRGNVSKTTIDLKTLLPRVEVADFNKYTEDLRAADDVVKGVIIVTKAMIKSADDGPDKKELNQVLRQRMHDVIEKTTATINSGKITGNDLADAYCGRGSAYSTLGQVNDAMKDANEAVKLAPTVGEYLVCRAEILFEAEDFQKSIADVSQAITLGAINSRAFRQRGVSRFYMGDFGGAADDLSKASGMADSESQVYIDLWLALANLRLGKPVPDVIVRRSALEAHGDWPRPALAALAQHIAPEEVLKILDAKIGDERVMALAEGYFYLGQFYLVNGNATRAKELFEKAVQQQVIIYTEHRAALFELKRLNEAH